MNVAVVGAGHVGLAVGVAFAYIGHRVVCIEKDSTKLKLLCAGKTPVYEQGLEDLLQAVRGNLQFASRVEEAITGTEVIILAVETPSGADGYGDVSSLEKAVEEVASSLQENHTYCVMIKSTVPVGTNQRVSQMFQRILEKRGLAGRTSVTVVSNPEFLREGRAIHDVLYPDRIVVGCFTSHGLETARHLYQRILEQDFNPPPVLPSAKGLSDPSFCGY